MDSMCISYQRILCGINFHLYRDRPWDGVEMDRVEASRNAFDGFSSALMHQFLVDRSANGVKRTRGTEHMELPGTLLTSVDCSWACISSEDLQTTNDQLLENVPMC